MRDETAIVLADGDLAELAQIARDVEATREAIAAAQAAQARLLGRAFALAQQHAATQPAPTRAHDMALRAIAAELAGPLRTTDRSAQRQINDAAEIVASYPAAVDAWEQGILTHAHVRMIADLGLPLPPEKRPDFDTIATAVCESTTPGRARLRLAPIAERLHPRTLTERHQQARETRAVRVADLGDGMSDLIATLPTVLAHAVYDRLTAQGRTIVDARGRARHHRDPNGEKTDPAKTYEKLIPSDVLSTDERTIDQIRADVLTDMLLTAAPDADPTRIDDGPGALGAIRAKVQVVVPALTALGTDGGPADLVGRAPIDAETARRLLGTTTHPLERLLTDPVTGSVIEVDSYQRPVSLDRYLRARDQHCRFPGCRVAAVRCEVDHVHDWALGGRTHRDNLAHECQRHHSMKQFTAWRVRQLHGGVLEWTSPLGTVYTEEPSSPVTFMPDDDPPGSDPADGEPPGSDPPDSTPPGDEGFPF